MELTEKEYVEQLYQGEMKVIIGSLIRIEERLTELKLHKFATSIKAIVIALNVEEMNLSKTIVKNEPNEQAKKFAQDLLDFKE